MSFHPLLRILDNMKLDEKLFSRLIKDIQTYPDMNQRLQSKVDVNFLFGYINWDIIPSTLNGNAGMITSER